jgi:hypothetical protein
MLSIADAGMLALAFVLLSQDARLLERAVAKP